MAKRYWAVVFAALLAAAQAGAAFDADVETELLNAFGVLAQSNNADAAKFIGNYVVDPSYPVEDWQALFKKYFKEGGYFAPSHGAFWDYLLGNTAGSVQSRTGLLSGVWACQAIGASLGPGAAGDPAAFQTLAAGFSWLGRIAAGLGANGRSAVFSGLGDAVGKQNIAALAASPRTYGTYVQYGLTLAEYAPGNPNSRKVVSRIMGFQGATQLFWEARGILLFDNGSLDAQQLSSLDLLQTVIPSELHNIGAYIVPEATGIDPATANFITPVQTVYLQPYPMGAMTNPEEFVHRTGQPVAPLFTISTAASMVRAIQQIQFAVRPELRARRDIILANARDKRERYLRRFQMVPPEVYLNDPDTLLPSVAYLYFIDSSRAFRMATYLFELEKQEAMDSFLLLADMFSGGTGTTTLYATDPAGRVAWSRAPIARTYVPQIRQAAPDDFGFAGDVVPAGFYFCTGIGINGYTYTFDLDPQGISIRVYRR